MTIIIKAWNPQTKNTNNSIHRNDRLSKKCVIYQWQEHLQNNIVVLYAWRCIFVKCIFTLNPRLCRKFWLNFLNPISIILSCVESQVSFIIQHQSSQQQSKGIREQYLILNFTLFRSELVNLVVTFLWTCKMKRNNFAKQT